MGRERHLRGQGGERDKRKGGRKEAHHGRVGGGRGVRRRGL